MKNPELGKVITINHTRKGTLTLLITDTSSKTWISGILMNRKPVKGLQGRDKWFQGEEMTVRRSFCNSWKCGKE